MHTVRSNANDLESGPQKPRRKFLRQLAVLFGGLTVWSATASASSENNPTTIFEQNFIDYPKPKYLPPGFVEVTAISGQRPNRLDGFGDNPNDVVLWYRTKFHERGSSNPLSVYISRSPQKQFVGVEGHAPATIDIPKGPNLTISGEYYDGMWMPSPTGERVLPKGTRLKWDTSNVHSLIFRFGGYTFAIRGSRVVGIELKDLVQIASSIE